MSSPRPTLPALTSPRRATRAAACADGCAASRLSLAASLALVACGKEPARGRARCVPFARLTVGQLSSATNARLRGRGARPPRRSRDWRFRVGGKITQRPVNLGEPRQGRPGAGPGRPGRTCASARTRAARRPHGGAGQLRGRLPSTTSATRTCGAPGLHQRGRPRAPQQRALQAAKAQFDQGAARPGPACRPTRPPMRR